MDNEGIAVADQLPPGAELVETLIPGRPEPRSLVWRDGLWLTIAEGLFEGPTPTHWRRSRTPG